jgi:FkbM family methyltransferase
MTVLDIGAWIGPTTLYLAHKARKVIAFEPDPVARNTLSENISRNNLENVQVVEACVSTEDGKANLGVVKEPGSPESSMLSSKNEWTVDAISFNTIFEKYVEREPVFAKIDIEGAEFDLIPHSNDVLLRHVCGIHLSTHAFRKSVLEYGGSGGLSGLLRRWEMFRSRFRLSMSLQNWKYVLDENGRKLSLLSYALSGLIKEQLLANMVGNMPDEGIVLLAKKPWS